MRLWRKVWSVRRALLCLGLLWVSCKGKGPAYPTIVVDEAHLQLQHADGSAPVDYAISPGPGLILDASGYKFQIPAQLELAAPDSVSIVVGKGQMYAAEWKPAEGRVQLDATTMTPVGHAPAFTGFPAGTTVALGIGHTEKTLGAKSRFSVIWAGMVNVK